MHDRENYRRWQTERLQAHMWHCGDDYDGGCHQPQIDRLTPNHKAGYPWIHRETVWSGTFHNEPTAEEFAQMEAELREACERYGLPAPDEIASR